jgi:uncharacterized protein (TIGR02444 family)
MSLENPLWHYALTLYSRPGVEQCCLQLQDQGAVVNRLLFACWLASRGIRLDRSRLRQADARWHGEVTQPLRALRFRLRNQLTALPEAAACYRALGQAELAAEQVELMLLWQHSQGWVADRKVSAALFHHNLHQAGGECHGQVDPLLLQLQSAALELLADE